jgi:Na+/H+ antiporter NhaD/arsenite permease-like protein
MAILMIIIFVLGYVVIALEHPLKINKSATALLLGVLIWVIYMFGGESILSFTDNKENFSLFLNSNPTAHFYDFISHNQLLEHLGEISEILFFLLGAMTIVELVDKHEGFRIITDKITTTNKRKLLWIIAFITFFLSAVLDNLTTSIVMIALLRKLIVNKEDRWFFGGMVILAANSGGAWSPIGDITTIMLWIGGQITSINIILKIFIPSLISMIVPLAFISLSMKGEIPKIEKEINNDRLEKKLQTQRNFMFFMGIGALLFVSIFKTLTHLPPYLGMLFGLSILWITTELLHKNKSIKNRNFYSVSGVLQKIDTPSILFFLGILIAVAGLQSAGHLRMLSVYLDQNIGNFYIVNLIIGTLSAIVDNVPLVAGAMGMYDLAIYPVDHAFWEFLAYCAGTGGSMLIIGSAAGVAVMGMEKIDFIWYLKKISLWALLGYLSGALAFYLLNEYLY